MALLYAAGASMTDRYNQAALRHYADAQRLAAAGRYDNAGHLIGFAAECAIKHAVGLVEPVDKSLHIHLPELTGAVLKRLRNRNPRQSPMRNLLEASRGGFFHDWAVKKRYHADNTVDRDTFERWRGLAERALGAANLRLQTPC